MEHERLHQTRPSSALAILFTKVPEVADLVVGDLDPGDTTALLAKTEPALNSFLPWARGWNRSVVEDQRGKEEEEKGSASTAFLASSSIRE